MNLGQLGKKDFFTVSHLFNFIPVFINVYMDLIKPVKMIFYYWKQHISYETKSISSNIKSTIFSLV